LVISTAFAHDHPCLFTPYWWSIGGSPQAIIVIISRPCVMIAVPMAAPACGCRETTKLPNTGSGGGFTKTGTVTDYTPGP
jgi:hypothetical protein